MAAHGVKFRKHKALKPIRLSRVDRAVI